MKYKVGQKVKIRSLEWYRDNVNRYGIIECGKYEFFEPMNEYCGEVVTIKRMDDDSYRIDTDKGDFCWTDEMIECKVEDTITTNEQLFKPSNISLEKEMEWNLPDGYIFKDENGNVINAKKIVLEKKKKEYPKTFLECCDVLNIGNLIKRGVKGYKAELFDTLQKLYICRDAYWKIAGREMGLNRPWEPDWKNDEQFKYIIICRRGCIIKDTYTAKDIILSFPTEEMRDAFYENFKELIEQCKELL